MDFAKVHFAGTLAALEQVPHKSTVVLYGELVLVTKQDKFVDDLYVAQGSRYTKRFGMDYFNAKAQAQHKLFAFVQKEALFTIVERKLTAHLLFDVYLQWGLKQKVSTQLLHVVNLPDGGITLHHYTFTDGILASFTEKQFSSSFNSHFMSQSFQSELSKLIAEKGDAALVLDANDHQSFSKVDRLDKQAVFSAAKFVRKVNLDYIDELNSFGKRLRPFIPVTVLGMNLVLLYALSSAYGMFYAQSQEKFSKLEQQAPVTQQQQFTPTLLRELQDKKKAVQSTTANNSADLLTIINQLAAQSHFTLIELKLRNDRPSVVASQFSSDAPYLTLLIKLNTNNLSLVDCSKEITSRLALQKVRIKLTPISDEVPEETTAELRIYKEYTYEQ